MHRTRDGGRRQNALAYYVSIPSDPQSVAKFLVEAQPQRAWSEAHNAGRHTVFVKAAHSIEEYRISLHDRTALSFHGREIPPQGRAG